MCVLGQSMALADTKQKTTPVSKTKIMKNKPVEKVFTATGQAPSPSKDFFELVVAKDRIIWRVWRIKYKNHRMIMPSEDCLTYEDYQYDGRVQSEINKNLGDDVLQISLGYASKQWLARVPMGVLLRIVTHLTIKDLTNLSQVCSVLRIRCLDSDLWKHCFSQAFGAWDELRERRAKRVGWRKVFIEEWDRKNTNKINWDDL